LEWFGTVGSHVESHSPAFLELMDKVSAKRRIARSKTLQKKQKGAAFVTPDLDHEAREKRGLQIPALAGRLTWFASKVVVLSRRRV
jgi:hypothetical protein